MLRPIFAEPRPGCTCAAIEYESGAVRVVPHPRCAAHQDYFPPKPLTEREKYERAMKGD